jgi:hypothetical protein
MTAAATAARDRRKNFIAFFTFYDFLSVKNLSKKKIQNFWSETNTLLWYGLGTF